MPFDKNLKRRFESRKIPETEAPKFEVEKSHDPFLNPNLLQNFDLGSKFTVVDKILGPFTSIGDIPVFYNFYKYINDFKVFFPNEVQAGFIIPVQLRRLILVNTNVSALTLIKGNVWIRADLLDPAAPKINYVGININSGKITFPNAFPLGDNSMTIPKMGRFEVDLTLDNVFTVEGNPTNVGIDAKKTNFTPPATLKLVYNNAKITISTPDIFHCSCFGWESDLQASSQQFVWDSDSKSLLFKLALQNNDFAIANCESAYYNLSGSAAIEIANWMLPSKVLNQNQSLEVLFNGLLRLDLKEGLSIDYEGIRNEDSTIKINACQLTLNNGQIHLIGKDADYNLLHEHYTLWQKSIEKPYKMDWDLSFSNYKMFTLQVQSVGFEIFSANVDSDFLIDKPVRANNQPIHPKTKKSIYVKGMSSDKKVVLLLDSDLLTEDDDPNKPIETTIYQFAIENAYFTTSKEAKHQYFRRDCHFYI